MHLLGKPSQNTYAFFASTMVGEPIRSDTCWHLGLPHLA